MVLNAGTDHGQLDMDSLIPRLQEHFPSLAIIRREDVSPYFGLYLADSNLQTIMGPFYPTRPSRTEDFFGVVQISYDDKPFRLTERFFFGIHGHERVIDIAEKFASRIGFIPRHYDIEGNVIKFDPSGKILWYNRVDSISITEPVIPPIYSHSIATRYNHPLKPCQLEPELWKHIEAYATYGREITTKS